MPLKPLLSESDLLKCSLQDLLTLGPENFDRIISEREVTHIANLCDAFWRYDGDPSKPHVLLSEGWHSNGFINTRLMLSYTNICQILALQAIRVIQQYYEEPFGGPHLWALGSSTAAADFSKDVANFIGGRHDVFLPQDKKQIWKGQQIPLDDSVVQIEELMTIGAATFAVRDGLRAAHDNQINFLPFIFVLIHRSDLYEIEGCPIHFLAHYDFSCVKPKACDDCKQGSKAIPAKGANWLRLTKGYTGNPCSECGQFMVVRCGVAVKCQSCGATSGCS